MEKALQQRFLRRELAGFFRRPRVERRRGNVCGLRAFRLARGRPSRPDCACCWPAVSIFQLE
jgi:hypothetical protein